MFVIKNARLHTSEGETLEKGYVAVKDGKILETGTAFDASRFDGFEIVDAKDRVVTPGLVDAHCHVGLIEEGIRFEGDDVNEMTDPVYPELRGLDAVNPRDRSVRRTLESGVTTVVTGPGSANVIGGTFCAMKTHGETAERMVFKDEVCMKMALGENPKRVYAEKKKTPSTRMASAAIMREWLIRAKEYKDALDAYEAGVSDAKKPSFDMKLDSLKRVFEGMPVKIHAHRADDIMTAIRIVKEFGLQATIDHATEAYLIVDTIKESGLSVILGPTMGFPGKFETAQLSFESGRILTDKGVPFAIMTDHPVVATTFTMVQAALYVKAGLSREEALKAVTKNAAELNGIDDRVGSLKKGKDADIVIWDGDPFDIMSSPEAVYIEGRSVHRKGD